MPTNDFSLLDGALVIIAVAASWLMFRPKIRDAAFWRATVTPLASIIGSGFLVVVPLLASTVGNLSVFAIAGIVLVSFWMGAALRFNILYDGRRPTSQAGTITHSIERFSDLALAFAYVISITFYVRLMAGFVLTGVDVYTPFNANILATAVLMFIGIYGLLHGLKGLESLETYSVTVKLAIIAALLAGLVYFDFSTGYNFSSVPSPSLGIWDSIRQLAGMLLIVQGFETSKYLDTQYPPQLRVRSMLLAQWLAGFIYIAFVALAMPLFTVNEGTVPNETEIIHLSARVAMVLPVLLVIAAAMSQFSAAIADTIGASGVIEHETAGRFPAKYCYPFLSALAIVLMWSSHIFEIVTLASRAFAFYYMFQAALAAWLAFNRIDDPHRSYRVASFGALACLLLLIVMWASPVAT